MLPSTLYLSFSECSFAKSNSSEREREKKREMKNDGAECRWMNGVRVGTHTQNTAKAQYGSLLFSNGFFAICLATF